MPIARSSLSLKSRLTIVTLVVAFVAIAVVGYQGYRSGESALRAKIHDQLTGLRLARSRQIESYFSDLRQHSRTIAQSPSTAEAVRAFREALADWSEEEVREDELQRVRRFYEASILPGLAGAMEGGADAALLLPQTALGVHLQDQYLASNPNPVGDKQRLESAGDGSPPSLAHDRHHPVFRDFVERFEFYDLLLVDAETGSVLYSVYKEIDFATNLYTGPHRGTHLSWAVRQTRDHPVRGHVVFTDFDHYAPSGMAPTAFLTSAVQDQGKVTAIVALQVPILRINRIMTDGGNWREDGLGDSGETYLLGEDFLMRSGSRFMIEDPVAYLAEMQARGMPASLIDEVRRQGTTILTQKV